MKKLSKHDFLDMIKSTAAANTEVQQQGTSEASKPAQPSSKSKWGALQDDYMLNSKLKDWDKESSDEEEENDGNEDWASDEDASSAVKEKPSKKQRISAK